MKNTENVTQRNINYVLIHCDIIDIRSSNIFYCFTLNHYKSYIRNIYIFMRYEINRK